MSGGGYTAEQRDGDMHAIVSKDTSRTTQTLRYQRTSFDHVIAQAFNQHFNELDYEFGLTVARRSRVTARAGRRSAFSLFDTPPQMVDSGSGLARPSTQGQSDTAYATSGITFEPNGRVSLGITGSLDQQRASSITTTSQLLTSTARLEPFGGLSLSASGNYGTRGQIVDDVAVTVQTRSVQAGANYRVGVRWLELSVAGTRRLGENSALDGRVGRVNGWSGDSAVSMSLRGMSVTGGYDRAHGQDAILDFGNFDVRRRRVSLQFTGSRVGVSGSWDRSASDRGLGSTFMQALQQTYSASLSFRWRESLLSANGGGFDSRTALGRDRTYFVGATSESHVGKVRVSGSLRQELTAASATHLHQWNLVGFVKAEYLRRLFGFAFEYRQSALHLQFDQVLTPTDFRGRQFSVRMSRRFGVRL